MTYTVGEVAAASGVTVRTLHHYDQIGVLSPSRRSRAGYRIYSDQDLERLQEVLFFRQLGFGLDEIRKALADPSIDRRRVLLQQRAMMVEEIGRYRKMVSAIDDALDSIDKGTKMKKEDMFEVFGDFDPSEYEEEAGERWGDTEAHQESARRTSSYGKEEWKNLRAESEKIACGLASLLESGADPAGVAAMDLAEEHRRHITQWFYPCSHEVHVGLGEMYVGDPRFTKFWDDYSPGLATFVRAAFRANAERAASG